MSMKTIAYLICLGLFLLVGATGCEHEHHHDHGYGGSYDGSYRGYGHDHYPGDDYHYHD
jgi:hypothetical protein